MTGYIPDTTRNNGTLPIISPILPAPNQFLSCTQSIVSCIIPGIPSYLYPYSVPTCTTQFSFPPQSALFLSPPKKQLLDVTPITLLLFLPFELIRELLSFPNALDRFSTIPSPSPCLLAFFIFPFSFSPVTPSRSRPVLPFDFPTVVPFSRLRLFSSPSVITPFYQIILPAPTPVATSSVTQIFRLGYIARGRPWSFTSRSDLRFQSKKNSGRRKQLAAHSPGK